MRHGPRSGGLPLASARRARCITRDRGACVLEPLLPLSLPLTQSGHQHKAAQNDDEAQPLFQRALDALDYSSDVAKRLRQMSGPDPYHLTVNVAKRLDELMDSAEKYADHICKVSAFRED